MIIMKCQATECYRINESEAMEWIPVGEICGTVLTFNQKCQWFECPSCETIVGVDKTQRRLPISSGCSCYGRIWKRESIGRKCSTCQMVVV